MITDAIENTVLTKEAILELIVSFAYIDDELHPKELETLQNICGTLTISEQQLQIKIQDYTNTNEDREFLCYQALEAIESKYVRERLVGFLIQLATSDNFHHKKELKLLNAIKEKWGLEVSIGREFDWDKEQKAVIFSDYRDRMLVYAGPGMGKTAVACARVSELIEQNVEPSNIWLLSFTRTAVKEITDRISSFVDHNFSALGVKVTTIDSKAWKIRYGLSETEASKLFGGFEQNIEEAIRIFDEKKEEMHENFSMLEHIIIDEAQDITGARAELLIKILELLNPECGFTIFADPAQAIYGFTEDDLKNEKRLNFLDCAITLFKTHIKEKELKSIHRTKNPKLINLIEDLRLDIYVNDNVSVKVYEDRENLVKKCADREAGYFDSKELLNKNSTLVLFRRRSEVLLASYFACKDNIPHRIRMSGHTLGIFSWVGKVFCNYPERRISKEQFINLCHQKVDLFLTANEHQFEEWWSLLLAIAGNNELVDVSRLRVILSRNLPPVSLCYPDLGNKGPILGTIHASKGREADSVILRLPFRSQASHDHNFDCDEESRVLYVGATRARNELAVGPGFLKQSFAKKLDSGRIYNKTPNKYSLATVEIGRPKELNEYSFVSRDRALSDVINAQKKLSALSAKTPFELFAKREKIGTEYIYKIWTNSYGGDVDRCIGEFDQYFNKELFDIARSFGSCNSPTKLQPFYMLGIRTVCKPENDPGLQAIHEPFSRTGFWIVPIIIGYPSCLFPARKRVGY